MSDVTPFLNRVHLAPFNVTLKGAHEWKYPVHTTPFAKHSIERNSLQVIELIARKKIILEPLLSKVISPAECTTVYNELRDKKDQYIGIVFDWSKLKT